MINRILKAISIGLVTVGSLVPVEAQPPTFSVAVAPDVTTNYCAPLLVDPRWQLHASKLLFLGTVTTACEVAWQASTEMVVDTAWAGEIVPGQTVCVPLRSGNCQKNARGERLLVWSTCTETDVLSRAPHEFGGPCTAFPLVEADAIMFFAYVLSTAPSVERAEVAAKFHAWESGQLSSESLYSWVFWVNHYRDPTDWNEEGRSLTADALWDIQRWLEFSRNLAVPDACRFVPQIAKPIVELFSAEHATSGGELVRWVEVRDGLHDRMNGCRGGSALR